MHVLVHLLIIVQNLKKISLFQLFVRSEKEMARGQEVDREAEVCFQNIL
jgi:hypothetical protein